MTEYDMGLALAILIFCTMCVLTLIILSIYRTIVTRRLMYDNIQSLRTSSKAHSRSYDLLYLHLSRRQVYTMNHYNYIICRGGKTKRRYKILLDRASFNIRRGSERYCIMVTDYKIPIFDVVLAQMLMIMYYEDDFLRIANLGE